jgi:hypothetical protein
MTYTQAVTYAGLNGLPECYAERWDEFLALKPEPLWQDSYLIENQALFGFNDELTASILRVKKVIEADETLDILARFYHWILFVGNKPFLVEKPYSLLPEKLGTDMGLFGMVVLLCETRRTLRAIDEFGLDFDNITGNFKSLANFANEYRKSNGHWGLDGFSWNCSCVVPYYNKCGHLGFEPISIEYDYTYYYNEKTGHSIVLCGDGIDCTSDGLLTSGNCPFPAAFTTRASKGDGWVEGFPVAPLGVIENRTVRISLDEYTPLIKQWDVLLAFHIPSGPGYSPESCYASFKEAVRFFRRVFPDIDFKGIWCYSWLYTPQLRLVLTPEESAMIQVQKRNYQVPGWRDNGAYTRFVFKTETLEPSTLPRTNRLFRRLAAIIERGGYLSSGGLLLPNSLIDGWMQNDYDDSETLKAFRAAQPYETGDLLEL